MMQLSDQQVRFAPPARRQEQLVRAERLMSEIEPSKMYPYQFVCFRITDFRPDSYPDLLIGGEDLKHDLVAFLEEVSRSLPAVPVEEVAEPVLTLEQISQRLNVSTKTITRWRERGLIGRRVLCNGRRQLGFMQSTVDRFLAANRTAVERGSRFSQLSDDEKEQILVRAKRLSRFGSASDRGQPPHRQAAGPVAGDRPLHHQELRPRASRTAAFPRGHRAAVAGVQGDHL